jgi:uncharacterized membrane protein
MNFVTDIFSFFCSQEASRSFAVAGHLLPVCQRCTGLYMGMGITFVYLLLNRSYSRDLPPRSVIYVNIACLLAMPIFGFHLLDPGPAWRLWSGLLYGSAIVWLLVPATSVICGKGRILNGDSHDSATSFWLLFAFLNSMPFWFPAQSIWFYYAGLLFILVGLLCVVFCVLSVILVLINRFLMPALLKGVNNEYAKNQDSQS